jgi:hypothetical protein
MKKTYIFYLFVILFLVYFTVSINYVEGDDASTILYHLIGRDSNLQEPYAKYNSGIDYLLSFIDNQEENKLKLFAFCISFFFSTIILFLFVELFKTICLIKKEKLNYSFFIFLPLIMPEILFNTLVINSSNISYFFSILSLIFFLKSLNIVCFKNYINPYFFFSIICFGIALPFRWSIVMFLPVFFCFHYFLFEHNLIKIIKINFFHIALSLIVGFSFIYLTGYKLDDFFQTIIWGKSYSENKEISFQVIFATGSAFLTPIVIVLLIIGVVKYIFIDKLVLKNIIFFIFPLTPFFILGFFPSYKFLFPIFPLVLFVLYTGYNYVFLSKKKITVVFVSIGVILIWFVGVQISDNKYAYGNSFEFKNPNKLSQEYISHKKNKTVDLNFDGGTFMPTLEGGRPLYGYFYVFKYQWKKVIKAQQMVLNSIVNTLDINGDIILIQDRKTAFLQCTLFQLGYKTQMPFKSFSKEFLYRDFYKQNKIIRLYAIKDNTIRTRVQIANEYLLSDKKVIFRSSYSSLIRDIYLEKNNSKNFWDIYTLTNF